MILILGWIVVLQDSTALERARLLAESGRVPEAIRWLEEHSSSSPTAPELVLLAELHVAVGALPQAAASLERALSLAPEQLGLRVTRGAMLFELRRFDEARRELERVLEARSDAALAHYYLAAVLKGAGELERARRSAERAVALLALDESSFDVAAVAPPAAARHLLAEILVELGEDAEPLLREVLRLEPLLAPSHYLLGRILLSRGQADEAERELQLFRRIQRADAHLALARDLQKIPERREEAVAELRRAIEAHPDHTRALFLLGRELLGAGREDEAKVFLDRAVNLQPGLAKEVARFFPSSR